LGGNLPCRAWLMRWQVVPLSADSLYLRLRPMPLRSGCGSPPASRSIPDRSPFCADPRNVAVTASPLSSTAAEGHRHDRVTPAHRGPLSRWRRRGRFSYWRSPRSARRRRRRRNPSRQRATGYRAVGPCAVGRLIPDHRYDEAAAGEVTRHCGVRRRHAVPFRKIQQDGKALLRGCDRGVEFYASFHPALDRQKSLVSKIIGSGPDARLRFGRIPELDGYAAATRVRRRP
jgi:hypothetical protein